MGATAIRLRTAALTVVLALASVALLPAAAQASVGTTLPFTSFFRMRVDDAHGLVFASGGPGSSQLAVLDESGTVVTTIPLQGASGMALVGSSLFVTESDAPDVAVIDTTAVPPAVDHTLEVGSFTEPQDLTYVQGRLWFFTQSGLATMLPDGTGLRGPYPPGALAPTRFADGLAGGRDLIVFEPGISTVPIYRYTATLPPRRRDMAYGPGDAGNAAQLAVTPGGATLMIAAGAPYSFPEVRVADMAALRAYAASNYPTAVAVTTAHGGLVAGGVDGSYNPDIWVYREGYAASIFSYDFGTTTQTVTRGGIAWSTDGDAVFAITGDGGGGLSFNVITPTGLPTLSSSSVSLTTSAITVQQGTSIDVTVHLDGGATNRDVRVYSQPAGGGGRTLIGSGTVDGAGDFVVAGYVPPWTTTITAVYSGDDIWGPSSGVATVDVGSAISAELHRYVRTAGRMHLYRAGAVPTLYAALTPSIGVGIASFPVERNRGNGWHRWLTFEPLYWSSEGTYRLYLPAPVKGTRYRVRAKAQWTGSYLGSASSWRYYRAVT